MGSIGLLTLGSLHYGQTKHVFAAKKKSSTTGSVLR
jgi:hypothetical protein